LRNVQIILVAHTERIVTTEHIHIQ
jgi:hypothetical protein